MNLKQALARGKLKQFAKEHENKDPHPQGKEHFDKLMDLMSRGVLHSPMAALPMTYIDERGQLFCRRPAKPTKRIMPGRRADGEMPCDRNSHVRGGCRRQTHECGPIDFTRGRATPSSSPGRTMTRR